MPDQPELRQRLAEVMREHRFDTCSEASPGYSAYWGRCRACGWESERRQRHGPEWELNLRDDENAHVISALLVLPGIAITTVPQPESTTTDIGGDGLKTAQFPHDITAWGGEYPGVMDCDADMSIEVARSLAASLLAAANFAEAGVAEEQTNA